MILALFPCNGVWILQHKHISMTNFLCSYGMRMQASISTVYRWPPPWQRRWHWLASDRLTDSCCAKAAAANNTEVWAPSSAWSRRNACLLLQLLTFSWQYNTCKGRWWTEKLSRNSVPTLLIFVPYCCYCLILSVALISTVVWVPIAWHRWSASGPQQLRGCWVRGAGCGGKEEH